MAEYENIGEICKHRDEGLFDWIIPVSWYLNETQSICLMSPHIHIQESSWYLSLYPNGHERYQSKGWSGLFLHRADIGSPINVTYTLELKCVWKSVKFEKTHIFNGRIGNSGEPLLFEKVLMTRYPMNRLKTITCQLKIYSFTLLQGILSVPFSIQNETPNSVSCAIQREIPDSLSCAIQTEIPDSVSCATQTEIPVRVTDKENSKDENGSSLDTEEDAILRDRMKKLFINGSDYDVTICVQDKEFRAHRNILSSRSPVFAMMLTHDTKENNTGTISVEDCDPDTFNEFLQYVYSGRTENLTPDNALQLYYTADKYDFPVLKKRCVNLLKTSLSITSICDVVLLAAKHQEKELLGVASEFFALNMDEILVSVSWQNFLMQNPLEANEMYIRGVKFLVPRK